MKTFNAVREAVRERLRSVDRQRYGLDPTTLNQYQLSQQKQDLESLRKQLNVYLPLFYLRGESTVGDDEDSGSESTLARGGLPFHWIEDGAALQWCTIAGTAVAMSSCGAW